MYYLHFSDGTYTGCNTSSLKKAIEYCNEYSLPVDVRKLDGDYGEAVQVIRKLCGHKGNSYSFASGNINLWSV